MPAQQPIIEIKVPQNGTVVHGPVVSLQIYLEVHAHPKREYQLCVGRKAHSAFLREGIGQSHVERCHELDDAANAGTLSFDRCDEQIIAVRLKADDLTVATSEAVVRFFDDPWCEWNPVVEPSRFTDFSIEESSPRARRLFTDGGSID